MKFVFRLLLVVASVLERCHGIMRSESSLFHCCWTSQDLLFGGDHVHLQVEGDMLGDYAAQRHVTA